MRYRVAFRGSAGLWALSPRFETLAEAERFAAALRTRQKRVVAVPPAGAAGRLVLRGAPRAREVRACSR